MATFPSFGKFGIVDRDFDDDLLGDTPAEILDSNEIRKIPTAMVAFGAITLLTMVAALFYHQVIKGGSNFLLAEKNRIRLERIPAPRGIVFDRHGTPLVRNVASYQLAVNPQDLPKESNERELIIDRVAQATGMEAQMIIEAVKQGQNEPPIILINNLNQDDALRFQVQLADLNGVEVVKIPQRVYVWQSSLAHILGYVSKPDKQFLNEHPDYDPRTMVGRANIEKVYEQFLNGKDGARRLEIDSTGKLQRVLATIPPTQGNNVALSIDLDFQKLVNDALGQALENSGSTKGAAVAMNPKTGEIYALVSLPDFDNNAFVSGNAGEILQAKDRPLVNRAIAGIYPSGSTIKPLWAAAAIEQNVVDEKFKVDTPPSIQIGEFSFPDWTDHGTTDIKTAIAQSNNIFFYGLAGGWGPIKGLGINRLVDYMRKFRFDQKTGIDLTGEQTGFIPTPEWKKKVRNQPWYIGDTYHLGIGQGEIGVTPIGLLVAQAAIHNGGKLVTPHVVTSITDEEGKELTKIDPPPKTDQLFNEKARQVSREGMRQTVTSGSARALGDLKDKTGLPVAAAAKTGTAQFGSQGKTHAWFVIFAPYEDPEIGMIVLVEGGGEGHATALPVAKKALEWWFNH